jgi:hypothetical protein
MKTATAWKGSGFLPGYPGGTWYGSQGHHGGGLVRILPKPWSASSCLCARVVPACCTGGLIVTVCFYQTHHNHHQNHQVVPAWCTGGPHCDNSIFINNSLATFLSATRVYSAAPVTSYCHPQTEGIHAPHRALRGRHHSINTWINLALGRNCTHTRLTTSSASQR